MARIRLQPGSGHVGRIVHKLLLAFFALRNHFGQFLISTKFKILVEKVRKFVFLEFLRKKIVKRKKIKNQKLTETKIKTKPNTKQEKNLPRSDIAGTRSSADWNLNNFRVPVSARQNTLKKTNK